MLIITCVVRIICTYNLYWLFKKSCLIINKKHIRLGPKSDFHGIQYILFLKFLTSEFSRFSLTWPTKLSSGKVKNFFTKNICCQQAPEFFHLSRWPTKNRKFDKIISSWKWYWPSNAFRLRDYFGGFVISLTLVRLIIFQTFSPGGARESKPQNASHVMLNFHYN